MSNKDASYVADSRTLRQETFWTWIDQRVCQVVTTMLQQVMEWTLTEQLAAAWNQRTDARRGHRNGHYRRHLTTPYGPLTVKIPRCRSGGLDCSAIFDRYQRRIADVDRILRHAYLLGTSTRGTAELAEQIFGGSVSHQTVSRLMRWLDGQLAAWRSQPIAPVYKVIYVDGLHVDILGGDRMVMVVAGLRTVDSRMEVLDFCVSTGEQCTDLLSRLRQRGLDSVQLLVSDEGSAIGAAAEMVYPEVAHQSCTFHRLKRLREKVGDTDFRDSMVREAGCIFRCPSRQAAGDAAAVWAHRWLPYAPGPVRGFMDGLEDSLMFYSLPQVWWKRTRTNNPLERLIRTLRQRLRPMGYFHDPPAIERAVFGQLARWRFLGTYTQ